jgi:methylphosphotriester-DNA--protein-cysteine methyltransferase
MMSEEMSRQRKWYYDNKDKAKTNMSKWRKANPDKVSELNRRYRENFKKKHGMSPSQYYQLKKAGVVKE